MNLDCDVLIIGGGPAGSSVGSLLKRYSPELRVVIIERETFPREHVGESQLPAVCQVLHEMGVWDKVEAAGFPVKIGGTYRWGRTDELWNVNFVLDEIQDIPRPAKYEGQRTRTAFQVDRGIYDKILLDHAKETGCQVIENFKVTEIKREGDRVTSVSAVSGKHAEPKGGARETVTIASRYFVDASGASGIIRRAMDVGIESPSNLRNVAFWDYWQDAEWAETVGNGGTRAQIMSIGWGWIWFIPITSTRTSIGLVTPASYLKSSGKSAEQLYDEALSIEPRISKLIEKAHSEGKFQGTKDWNYIADRLGGVNWFLAGDSCGFADPILSAGMTLAQVGARKVAYSILEMERGEVDCDWIVSEYTRTHRMNIRQHIRFADFWYSANGRFTDLKDYCTEIARDAGLDLTPDAAFRWIGTGGFASGVLAEESANIYGFQSARTIIGRFTGATISWAIAKNNRLKLNLVGASQDTFGHFVNGRVVPVKCYKRKDKVLPLTGKNQFIYSMINREADATRVARQIMNYLKSNPKEFPNPQGAYQETLEVLETLVSEGWITASVDKSRPFIPLGIAE